MTFLVKDAWDEISRATGIRPDSSDWQKHADYMIMNMSLTPSEIMAALKIGLTSQWHRGKIMDKGLAHVRYNYHQLVTSQKASNSEVRGGKPSLSYINLYKLGKHLNWEVEKHLWMAAYKEKYGSFPSIPEMHKYVDEWVITNWGVAEEWGDCPVCQDEIANQLLGFKAPIREVVDTSKLVDKIGSSDNLECSMLKTGYIDT